MREPASLSRRAAAALPLTALIRPATAAMPAIAASLAAGDAALLDLGRRWEAALAAELAQSALDRETMILSEVRAHEAEGDTLHQAVSALFDRIAETLTTTLQGLAVKARILAHENDLEMMDETSIADALRGAHYFEDRAAFSLALDVVRMARTAS